MRQGVIKVRAEGRSWVGGREGGSARSHAPGEAPAGTPRDGIWAGICGGRHFVARFPRMLPSVTTLAPRSAFASVCGSAYGRGCTLLQRARARSRCNWCACCVRAHARVRGACVIGWRLSCRVRVCVCMRLCVRARPPWYVILHARIRTQSYNACVCEREHENTCTRARTHTHAHIQAHTHTHIQTHTHTTHSDLEFAFSLVKGEKREMAKTPMGKDRRCTHRTWNVCGRRSSSSRRRRRRQKNDALRRNRKTGHEIKTGDTNT